MKSGVVMASQTNRMNQVRYFIEKKIMNYVMLYILYFKCTNYSK